MENKKIMLSSFITGTVLILTVGVLFKVYSWLWGHIYEFISPIQKALSSFLYINDGLLILLSFIILVSFSFFLGFFIRLIAKNKYESFLAKTLYKIPLFKIIQEAIHQLISKEDNNSFDRKCLAKVYSDAYSIGYIVDEMETEFIVYIPTAPIVSSGMIFVVKKESVIEIEVEGSDMLKVILSCGIGGGKIINKNQIETHKRH